jgi:hypothetical protein
MPKCKLDLALPAAGRKFIHLKQYFDFDGISSEGKHSDCL